MRLIFEPKESLARLMVENAPQLRSLKLPINPFLWPFDQGEGELPVVQLKANQDAEVRILSRVIKLDSTSWIDGRQFSQAGPRISASGIIPGLHRTSLSSSSTSEYLRDLKYLEFKIATNRHQTILKPLIHVDDHPFHSRILPPAQKLDYDPTREGKFVSYQDPVTLTSTWRWETQDSTYECERYQAWAASVGVTSAAEQAEEAAERAEEAAERARSARGNVRWMCSPPRAPPREVDSEDDEIPAGRVQARTREITPRPTRGHPHRRYSTPPRRSIPRMMDSEDEEIPTGRVQARVREVTPPDRIKVIGVTTSQSAHHRW